MPKLRVLIVDDAVVVRRILTDAMSAEADLEVFTAANGRIALAKLQQVNPDIVTLDMEMPEMDGLTALKELRKTYPKLPVIMFSTLTERGAGATLDALAAGANDYVTKPANVGSVAIAIQRIREELIPKIRALCGRATHSTTGTTVAARRIVARAPKSAEPIEVVAIGVSTGGPNALSVVLPMLPREFPVPIVIVQHMPPVFTKLLAERLKAQSAIGVAEGAAGMAVGAGKAIIAPGGMHMVVERKMGRVTVEVNMEPPLNSCRPSVDALFNSVVSVYGGRTLLVVMTGMGNDGLRGCELGREAGAQVVVQDEATSVVWGMPGYVARANLADAILPLNEIAGEIVRRVNLQRRLVPAVLSECGK